MNAQCLIRCALHYPDCRCHFGGYGIISRQIFSFMVLCKVATFIKNPLFLVKFYCLNRNTNCDLFELKGFSLRAALPTNSNNDERNCIYTDCDSMKGILCPTGTTKVHVYKKLRKKKQYLNHQGKGSSLNLK